MSDTEPVKIHRGLKGVYFERSGVSSIDGQAGELRYRGYSIHDLARHSSFEETAWLVFHGELPRRDELERFRRDLAAARQLPDEIYGLIETIKAPTPWTCCAPPSRRWPPSIPTPMTIRRRRAAQGHPPHLAGSDDRGGA
jgi:citrate synthase